MMLLSEMQAVHSQEGSFPVWYQLSKGKTKLRLEETGSPETGEMQSTEARGLKVFHDTVESSHINEVGG